MVSTFERASEVPKQDSLKMSGDDVKAQRLQQYQAESYAWPPSTEAMTDVAARKEMEEKMRNMFSPDHTHLRPTLPGGPEAGAGGRKR
ncbi:unnamed protein product [Polarella glacialis]|uniref:Uncharacterized protein n=1 Tax=Polarella glacialis TaxID=89957 RepID=A0A813FLB8_POLGL|nr:unnamed protein product [Polarella glacialis]|mmetsp:Transcript_58354/g.94407  ORF Transcript_58354/g.94407 Transcript_58354/m.94407 type:complete len:88 (-) Transcript_58354:138-401(-)